MSSKCIFKDAILKCQQINSNVQLLVTNLGKNAIKNISKFHAKDIKYKEPKTSLVISAYKQFLQIQSTQIIFFN